MKKSVTVQANTVEEAIQQALGILNITIEQADITVLANPGRRLMGFRKVPAEVTVAALENEQPQHAEKHQNEQETVSAASAPMSKIEQLASLLDEADAKNAETASAVQLVKAGAQTAAGGARIINGELQFDFTGDAFPSVVPHDNVALAVNGEMRKGITVIKPEDDVQLVVQDEISAAAFSIKLIEKDMIALLSFVPGKRVLRTLRDTPWSGRLVIRPEETEEATNDVKPQDIVEELKILGVQQGLLFSAIKKVTEVLKPYELIVAKGTLPVEGTDGDLEVHIRYDEFDPDSEEKVDFREMNAIANVKEGQIIATHVPPVEGTPGKSLLGREIPVKRVRDIVLRPGKNVELREGNIAALISGKPVLEWRDKLVKIDVNNEFNHPGEVGLESGNIRFEGDVRIGGNIQPSMFVGATGGVYVGGSMTKAEIHAMTEAVVRGNVLSSVITVGKHEAAVSELVDLAKQVAGLLAQIKQAVEQIFIIRGEGEADLDPSELKRLIYLLMEKRYAQFENVNKQFIQKVREKADGLDEEWISAANRLYELFVNPLNEDLQNMNDFERLLEDIEILVQLHNTESSPQTKISVPYAINSTLYSSGMIEVTSKGVYHSILTAERAIYVKGVCRGGELSAPVEVVLQETGSESPVKTIIRTSAEGCIKIGRAYAGTEIFIGPRKHVFTKDAVNISARLNAEEQISLG